MFDVREAQPYEIHRSISVNQHNIRAPKLALSRIISIGFNRKSSRMAGYIASFLKFSFSECIGTNSDFPTEFHRHGERMFSCDELFFFGFSCHVLRPFLFSFVKRFSMNESEIVNLMSVYVMIVSTSKCSHAAPLTLFFIFQGNVPIVNLITNQIGETKNDRSNKKMRRK